jgi:hypothetical protein
LPAGEPAPEVAGEGPACVRGFLIQTRGEFAGLATVTGGEVGVHGSSQEPGAKRRVTFDLRCEDGTRLTGSVRARRDDWRLRRFETQRRPADVEALTQPPVEPP